MDTPKGRAIISGLCTIQMNFEPPEQLSKIWPVITPGIHSDVEQAYESLMVCQILQLPYMTLSGRRWNQFLKYIWNAMDVYKRLDL